MQYTLPYGKEKQSITIPNSYSVEFISGEKERTIPDVNRVIDHAFSHPLCSAKLAELVHTGDSVVIIIDDYTRPCPSKQILPFILRELKQANILSSDITILVATGTHLPPNHDQLVQLLGEKIIKRYNVIFNDNDSSEYISIGKSTFDHEIEINKIYVDANVKIIISDIEYHYFAGYGGTRKSILPGIASRGTIQQNHSMMFDESATTGELVKNPVSIEMKEAFDMIGCDFSVGVVLNQKHDIVGMWTGEAHAVMNKGVELVDRLFAKKISHKPDMIITAADGHPHDINLYQALKALYTASKVIRENGIIILVAECKDGMGNKIYQEWLERYHSAEQIKSRLNDHFQIGAHKAYYHRDIIEHSSVYLFSSFNPSYVQKNLGFIPAQNLKETFDRIVLSDNTIENILIAPQGSTTRLVF